MKEETQKMLTQLGERLSHMNTYLVIEEKKEQIAVLEEKMQDSSFWGNQEKAQKVIEESNLLKSWVIPYE